MLHINCRDEHGEVKSSDWQQRLAAAAAKSGITAPRVVTVPSPFRFIASPILKYVKDTQQQFPKRKVAVIVPELVAGRWYQYHLHNHRSTALKGLLLMQGNRQVIVINVSWFLNA